MNFRFLVLFFIVFTNTGCAGIFIVGDNEFTVKNPNRIIKVKDEYQFISKDKYIFIASDFENSEGVVTKENVIAEIGQPEKTNGDLFYYGDQWDFIGFGLFVGTVPPVPLFLPILIPYKSYEYEMTFEENALKKVTNKNNGFKVAYSCGIVEGDFLIKLGCHVEK